MIPSFKSFPSLRPSPDSEVSTSFPKRESSKKGRKPRKDRNDDNKHERKHKQKFNRDCDSAKEENRGEPSYSSTTFFSDYKGDRAAAYGGSIDPIRVPKYNLVACTSLPNTVKYN